MNAALPLTALLAPLPVGVWAAEATDPATGVAAYIGGGATVILAGVVAEVARRLLNGRLIPREVKDFEEELGASIRAAGEREARAMEHGEQMRRTATRMAESVEGLAEQIRRVERRLEDR